MNNFVNFTYSVLFCFSIFAADLVTNVYLNAAIMKVRILVDNGFRPSSEIILDNLSPDVAKERFLFYVGACVSFNMASIRAVNLINGRKVIKTFSNHERRKF